jgi:hypothetical protein
VNTLYNVLMFTSMLAACGFCFWAIQREAEYKNINRQAVGVVVGVVLMFVFLVGANQTRPEPKPETFTCTQNENVLTCTKDPR